MNVPEVTGVATTRSVTAETDLGSAVQALFPVLLQVACAVRHRHLVAVGAGTLIVTRQTGLACGDGFLPVRVDVGVWIVRECDLVAALTI